MHAPSTAPEPPAVCLDSANSLQVTVTALLPNAKVAGAGKGKQARRFGKENALSALQPSSRGITKSGLAGSLRRTTRACAAH